MEDGNWKWVPESLPSRENSKANDNVQLNYRLLWREGLLSISKSIKYREMLLYKDDDFKDAGHFGKEQIS